MCTEVNKAKKPLLNFEVSLAEPKEKHQKAMETGAHLEIEKSNLKYQIVTL